MSEKLGIKETKEALIGVNEVALAIASVLKDGAQVGDVMALWAKLQGDPVVSAKLKDAGEKITLVPAEIGNVDLSEGVELATVQLAYIPKFIDALKKEAPVS